MTKEICEMCREYNQEDTCTGKQEPHVCPYGEEIHGDLTLCDCCENEEVECCEDVPLWKKEYDWSNRWYNKNYEIGEHNYTTYLGDNMTESEE